MRTDIPENVELITELSALRAIADPWRDLAESRGNAFVTPEWFFAWFNHYGEGHQPMVPVVWHEDGSLAGLMPLVLSLSNRPRTLRFAGANLGDRFHPVAAEGDEERVARAAAAALDRERRRWSTLVLENVDVAASWPQCLAEASPAPLAVIDLPPAVLPFISFSGMTWEEFQQTRSKNLRSQRGRKRRKLEREHDIHIRRSEGPDEVRGDMVTLFRLHDLRREPLGGSSLASETARAFHRDFATAALKRGWLRLWFLEANGEPVAANYDWRLKGTYSYYQAGFDPAWSRYSVGSVLEDHRLRAAIDEGAEEFEFLAGDEAFKLRQATGVRRVHTLMAVRALHPARLLATAEARLRRAARALPPNVRSRVRNLSGALLERSPTARRR